MKEVTGAARLCLARGSLLHLSLTWLLVKKLARRVSVIPTSLLRVQLLCKCVSLKNMEVAATTRSPQCHRDRLFVLCGDGMRQDTRQKT